MKSIFNRISQLTESLKTKGLEEFTPELEELEKLEEEEGEDDSERPLYQAHPTTIPGTWAEPDGDLIKTSRD